MPLPAGTSADRNGYSFKAAAATAGLANDLYVNELRSANLNVYGSGGSFGTGAMTGATHSCCSLGWPIQNSAPSGFAIRSATSCPMLFPDARRMTSPASQPYVHVS